MDELIPSVAVRVAVYEGVVSKSGAVTKVITPPEVTARSVPEMLNVIDELSTSVAVAVPIVV